MKKIKQLIKRHRDEIRLRKEAELMSSFKVEERGHSLWLVCNGVAFLEFSKDISAQKVTNAIDEARKAAVNFSRL